MNYFEAIHQKAIQCATQHRTSRAALIEALISVDRDRVWERRGFNSLHVYCVDALRLGNDEAYTLVAIARKSLAIPEIKTLVEEGKLTITNARRIAKEITPENKEFWLEKGQTLSQNDLLKEIVKIRPEEAMPERIRPIAENKSMFLAHISDSTKALWKELEDVTARKGKFSIDELLAMSFRALLERIDPLRKAQRAELRRKTKTAETERPKAPETPPQRNSSDRTPIPAKTKHQVFLRDGRQCGFRDPFGKRCESRRYLDVHHRRPVARGGLNSLENLLTLCSAHHRHVHRDNPQLFWSGPKEAGSHIHT